MLELWKIIPGYKGTYEASSFGRVRNVKTGRMRKHFVNNSGYACLQLSSNGTRKQFKIHRLVACAFVPNSDQKPQVNHIDGDKLNNCAFNLEWVTGSENIRHFYDNHYITGTQRKSKQGTDNPSSRLTEAQIQWVRRLRVDCTFTQKELAEIFNMSISGIQRILNRETWAYL